jgi:hypothetical protein
VLCLLVQVPNCTVLEKRTVIYFLCSEGVNSSELYSRPSAEVCCPGRFFWSRRRFFCNSLQLLLTQSGSLNLQLFPHTPYIYVQDLTPSDYHMFHHKSSIWLTKIFPVMTKFRTRCIIGFENNGKFLLRWGPRDL